MVEWCTRNSRRNGSISRGTSHATSTERNQYTTSVDINNTRYKRIESLIQNHMPMSAVSLPESREWRYIKAMNNNIRNWEPRTAISTFTLTSAPASMSISASVGCLRRKRKKKERKRKKRCFQFTACFHVFCNILLK